jgi:hypothetical protein
LESRRLLAVNLVFDYSLDTSGFFNDQDRKDALEFAGNSIVERFEDTLAAIPAPPSNVTVQATVQHPSLPGQQPTPVPFETAADTIVIYAGAHDIPAPALGNGGFSSPSFNFSFSSLAEQTAARDYVKLLLGRGEPGAVPDDPTDQAQQASFRATDFALSYGFVAFDNAASTDWYFGMDPDGIGAGQMDFITLATHEVAHALGFGTAPVWTVLTQGGYSGENANAAYTGGNVVPLTSGHWAQSVVDVQPSVMTPTIDNMRGRRVPFSVLDFAAMEDIGWEVSAVAANTAPALNAIAAQSATVGTELSFTASATDADAGTTLSFSLASGAPAGARITSAGVFSFTPTSAGTETVTVIVTDDGSPAMTDSQEVMITVEAPPVNMAPVLASIATQTATVGTALSFTASATDPDVGDMLTFSLGDGARTGASITSAGVFSFTPTSAGIETVTVIVTDNGSPAMMDSQEVTITVADPPSMNMPPVLVAIGAQTAAVGRELSFTVTATDPDAGNMLTFSLGDDAPAGAAIDGTSGEFTFTPMASGTETVNIIVTDSGDPTMTDSEVVTITIVPAENVQVDLLNPAATVVLVDGQIVVRNDSTALATVPASTLGELSVNGDASDNVITLDLSGGSVVPFGGLNIDGNSGANTLRLDGGDGTLDLTNAVQVQNVGTIDLGATNTNSIVIDAATVNALAPASNSVVVRGGEGDSVVFADRDQWRMGATTIIDARFIRSVDHSGGERLQTELANAWQNVIRVGDVNNNGEVTANDALVIINELAARRFSDGTTNVLNDAVTVAQWPNQYFDQNGDGSATGLDALRVINELARITPESESIEVGAVLTSSDSEPGQQPDLKSYHGELTSHARQMIATFGTTRSFDVQEPGDDAVAEESVIAPEAVDELLSSRSFLN